MLTKGMVAPGLERYATPDQKLLLIELKGKRVILAFILLTGTRCAAIKWLYTMRG